MDDADEYVRRRSLMALSVLGSKETERLAILAWETGRLYPRIEALHALSKIGSPKLEHFLGLVKQDGRAHLLANASELQIERNEKD
ncbi:MAG: HEAT repeat domain-containing protein [Yoonia sp.]|nr:HEAT repeat domain-containing protein [Yoonia sp.]